MFFVDFQISEEVPEISVFEWKMSSLSVFRKSTQFQCQIWIINFILSSMILTNLAHQLLFVRKYERVANLRANRAQIYIIMRRLLQIWRTFPSSQSTLAEKLLEQHFSKIELGIFFIWKVSLYVALLSRFCRKPTFYHKSLCGKLFFRTSFSHIIPLYTYEFQKCLKTLNFLISTLVIPIICTSAKKPYHFNKPP